MNELLIRLANTTAPRSVILIRLMTGGIFLTEGLQKFIMPEKVGAGPWSVDHRLFRHRP